MSEKVSPEVLGDEMAVSLARCVAAANCAAREEGVDPAESLLTITEVSEGQPRWRVEYGPKDYHNRRGDNLLIEVDAAEANVKRVIRGQ